jgi:hypothetical protein
MLSSGMLRRSVFVRTDVSEELSSSIIRVTRIGQLGITLAVTSNRARCEEIPRKRRLLQEPHGFTTYLHSHRREDFKSYKIFVFGNFS